MISEAIPLKSFLQVAIGIFNGGMSHTCTNIFQRSINCNLYLFAKHFGNKKIEWNIFRSTHFRFKAKPIANPGFSNKLTLVHVLKFVDCCYIRILRRFTLLVHHLRVKKAIICHTSWEAEKSEKARALNCTRGYWLFDWTTTVVSQQKETRELKFKTST